MKHNNPENKIKNLNETWNGKELDKVRNAHENNKVNSINVCKGCTFKDTYNWKKIDI